MKHTLIFVFSIINFFTSYAQNKIYSGKFENGTATYKYFETQDFDRIYDGEFNYNSLYYNLKGTFKNNQKDGEWLFSTSNNDKIIPWLRITTSLSGRYSGGKMEGLWNASYMHIGDRKAKNTFVIKPEIFKATAYFKDNKFIHSAKFQRTSPDFLIIDGSFSDDGFLDGIWTIKTTEVTDIRKYNKGILYWRLYKNYITGEKLNFFDNSKFVSAFLENFDLTNNISIVNNKYYYTDTLQCDSFEEESIQKEAILNEAIKIWQKEDFYIQWSRGIPNPLYYFKKGSEKPQAFIIEIKECIEGTECYEKQKNISILKNTDSLIQLKKYDDVIDKYKQEYQYLNSPEIEDYFNKLSQQLITLAKEAVVKNNFEEGIKFYGFSLSIKENLSANLERDSAILKRNSLNEQKLQKEKFDTELKKRQDELSTFLKERVNKSYSLEIINHPFYDSLKEKINNIVENNLKNSKITDINIEGYFSITIDTNGVCRYLTDDLISSNTDFLRETIDSLIQVIIPKQHLFNYPINGICTFYISGNVQNKTFASFEITDGNGANFSNGIPNEIKYQINDHYSGLAYLVEKRGKYKIKYGILTLNKVQNLYYQIISFKKSK